MRKLRWFALSAIILSLILAACAGQVEAPGEEGAEAPAGEPRLLRILGTNIPPPDYTLVATYADNQAMVNMYDSLVFPTIDGSVQPHVAESWEKSDDGLTWTFHMREGVKFHNGSEMKASDVVFSFNRMAALGSGFAYLFDGLVESATAVDDYTVEFKLLSPSSLFELDVVRLMILSEEEIMANLADGEYDEFGDYGREYLTTHDAGSGPYMVKELRPEEVLILERFDDWFMADEMVRPNSPDELHWLPITESATQRTMFANRDAEINDQWQTLESYQGLDEIDGVEVAALDTGTGLYLMIHTRKPPTDDIHFRRAMLYAFDYETALSFDWPGTKPLIGPVPSNIPGHNPDVTRFERDLDKAREELALSKYADQLDEVVVTIESAGDAHDERYGLLLQSNLAEIGITAETLRPPWLQMYEHYLDIDASASVMMIAITPDFPDVTVLLDLKYSSKTAADWPQNEWLLDEEFDALLAQAYATLDPDEKRSLELEMQEYVVDYAATIFVSAVPTKHAYQAEYIDWPSAQGELLPVNSYQMFGPFIEIFPEQRDALLE